MWIVGGSGAGDCALGWWQVLGNLWSVLPGSALILRVCVLSHLLSYVCGCTPRHTRTVYAVTSLAAARLCPEGVEATLFATLMSILNGGSFVGSALGAGLTQYLGVSSTDFSNLFLLVLLCNFSTLLPAPFLDLLPSSLDQDGLPAAATSAAAAPDADGKPPASSSSDGSSVQQGQGASHSQQRIQLKTQAGSGVVAAARERASRDVGEDEPLKSGRRK